MDLKLLAVILLIIVIVIASIMLIKSFLDSKKRDMEKIFQDETLVSITESINKINENFSVEQVNIKNSLDSINSSYRNLEKDVNVFKHKVDSLEKSSREASSEITALFSNGKSVGQIGEDYLYSTLIKLDCEDISSQVDLIEDDDILTYMIDNNIRFAFKRQYLLSDGSIPDCVIFCPIKINDETYSLKKVIVDSKAIINALKLNDGESLSEKLVTQMKGLAKKEYFRNVNDSFNNVILFFPFIGVLDLLKADEFKAYKELLVSFREKGIIFSTAENIYLSLEIILDGYNSHQLQETSKSKQELIDKAEEIALLQKQYKHGLKERINTSDALKYIGGTIKREISIYKYMLQFEDDIDNNEEIQSVLKDIENFK